MTLPIAFLAFSLLAPHVRADPNLIRVPDDHAKIQDAIDAASPGDTIFVKSGTYTEHLEIDKSLSLIGEDRETTTIGCHEPSWHETLINVTADHVKILRFTILHAAPNGDCIEIYSNENAVAENNILNGGNGIGLYHSTGNTIFNNRIRNSIPCWGAYGILLMYSNRNVVRGNLITNQLKNGLDMSCSESNNVSENTIAGTWYYDSWRATVSLYKSNTNSLCHNNFLNNTLYIYDSINNWDYGYPLGGNYWSDYDGTDMDTDGIGDCPYIMDVNNQDNYPLIEPWSEPTMIRTLIRTVKFWNLPKGIEHSLKSKLNGVLRSLDRGNENAARHLLLAFINEVESLTEKKLTNEQAHFIVTEARRIADHIRE